MTKAEKIRRIQGILEVKDPQEDLYADLLEAMGDLKANYGDYMITEPIDCDEELKRVPEADYELCTALLSMILREEHFSDGASDRGFAEEHFSDGASDRGFAEEQVVPVLVRMKDVLCAGV